jgi:hypothetical protein
MKGVRKPVMNGRRESLSNDIIEMNPYKWDKKTGLLIFQKERETLQSQSKMQW